MARLRPLIACIVLAGYLPMAGLGALHGRGVVLCIGQDGHVEMEAARAGVCADPHRGHAHDAADEPGPTVTGPPLWAANAEPHCGPCRDVALTAWTIQRTAPGQKRFAPDSDRIAARLPAAGPMSAARVSGPGPQRPLTSDPAMDATLRIVRTIIQLI